MRRLNPQLLALLGMLLLCPPVAADGTVIDGDATAGNLIALASHGLHAAWLVPNDSQRSAVQVQVLAGERDNDDVPGLAHYAEHLAWLSAIDGESSEAGRHSNAWTNQRTTVYLLDGPTRDLEKMVATLSRVLDSPTLDKDFANDERHIVQREYDYRYAESPADALDLEMAHMQHGSQWPGRAVIGTRQSITDLSAGRAHRWLARTHNKNNVAVFIMTNRSEKQANSLVEKYFGEQPSGQRIPPAEYTMQPARRQLKQRSEAQLAQPELRHSRVFKLSAPRSINALDTQLNLLHRLFISTLPGSLARPLRYDDFIAQNFDLEHSILDASHVELRFTGRPDRGVDLERFLDVLEATHRSLANEGIPEESFNRIRARMIDEMRVLDKPHQFVLDEGIARQSLGGDPLSLTGYQNLLADTTLEDINELVKALADAPRIASLLVTPEAEGKR